MKSWIVRALSICLFGVASLVSADQKKVPLDYWIWAGIRPESHMSNASLYIYQGNLRVVKEQLTYERRGLYCYPCLNAIYLVYRIVGKPPFPDQVKKIFEATARLWQRHHVKVRGLQLDFDAPSSKLLHYSRFLQDLRACLPQMYQLSITGLGDWAISGDPQTLKKISQQVDEIVFQLYQERELYAAIDQYIQALPTLGIPFKVGLLASRETQTYIKRLHASSFFRGTVLFVQKTRKIECSASSF